MLIKKAVSRPEAADVDQLINYLRHDDPKAGEWVSRHIHTMHLEQYFCGIHGLVKGKNLCHYKAYQTMPDGLYILLKGEVRFLGDERGEKQKMKKTKSSNFRSSITTICEAWAVFECTFKNCTTFDETYLLKISQQQALESRFYEFFANRNQLYSNKYLSQDHRQLYPCQGDTVFSVDIRIHSLFSFKSHFFREIICLLSPAIVSKGRAKLKHSNMQSHEFDRYGVLLPHLKYEVTSSEIEILVISPNQTLSYNYQQGMEIQNFTTCKTVKNSVHKMDVTASQYCASGLTKKQKDKRNKQLGRLSKDSQPFSILSGFLCEKSLSYAKRHNVLHCTKQKKENRYKNPLVLFNIANEKSKLAIPDFSDTSNASINQTTINYLTSFQSASQSQFSQASILRKLKLPSAQYNKIVKKHNQKSSLIDLRQGKSIKQAFNVTLDRIKADITQREENPDQYFVPYDKS